MFLWMALFWVGVIPLIVWGVRQFTPANRPRDGRALEILEERYARGKIDSDELATRRQILRG